MAKVPINGLCQSATEFSLASGCPSCSPAGDGSFLIHSTTRSSTIDVAAPGCGGSGNVSGGVWFRFMGQGHRVRLSIEIGLSVGDYPCGQHLSYVLDLSSESACCAGNADRLVLGRVDVKDLTAVLANFGVADQTGLGVGGADCNGSVEFADITWVLAQFGSECP
ncbi:MAG: hypothetical protein JNK58_14125 [Phycisphaerae bacterium]|nr:hypothetical protein [Phycisphaerae bacterium]